MYVCGRAGFDSCGLQTFLKNRNLVWILFLFFFTFFGIMKIQNKKNTSKKIRWWLDNGWKGKDVLVAQLKKTNGSPTPELSGSWTERQPG